MNPNRRWPRFSLRTLLLVITVGGIVLAIVTQWQAAKHRENQAGREILNRGGSVSYLNDRQFQNRGLVVRGLSLILPRDCLYTVKSVSFRKAGDDELALFPPLHYLQEVNLEGCKITDESLRHFSGLTDLTFLEISSTGISDAGMQHLSRHRQLTQLWLKDTNITDASLSWITQNRGLTHLQLSGTRITDQGCQQLVALPELKVLALRSTAVTNDVLPTVLQLPKLQYLNVMRTDIDDEAVPQLSRLKLSQLDVRQTKITQAGAERLKEALPNCSIEWMPPR